MKRIKKENINTLEYWNNKWLRKKKVKEFHIERFKIMCSFLSKNKDESIIDIGCGNGWFLDYLRRIGYKKIVGIDFSNLAVMECQRKGHSAFVNNCYDLILPDNLFDCVVSGELLEHIESPEYIFNKFCKIAKNKIIISIPNKNAIISREHIWSISKKDLLNFSKNKNFKIIKIYCKLGYLIANFLW